MSYAISDYQRERAIVDKAQAYWNANAEYSRGGWSRMSAEKCAHPDYAACDNAVRGRVEAFELQRDKPDVFTAYISSDGQSATTWPGDVIGRAECTGNYRGRNYSRVFCWRVTAFGREYYGRNSGRGMVINLRARKA